MTSRKRARQEDQQASAAPSVQDALVSKHRVELSVNSDQFDCSTHFDAAGLQLMVTRTGRGVTESEDEAADSEETGPAFALAVSVWADKQTLSGLTRSEIWSRVTLTMTLLHADDGSVLIQRGPVVPWDSKGYRSLDLCLERELFDPGFGAVQDDKYSLAIELSIPVPRQSTKGDVALVSADGVSLRAHSIYLMHSSAILEGLLETQTQELQQAAASGQPLVVPLHEHSCEQIHLLLQVLYQRNAGELLGSWSLSSLRSLGTLAHKLSCSDEIVRAIQNAMVAELTGPDAVRRPQMTSRDAVSFLTFAHQVDYPVLERVLLSSLAQKLSLTDLEGLGEPLLIKLISELQYQLRMRAAAGLHC